MAPEIDVPLRFHWYVSLLGVGAHVPAAAVSVEPTFVVPEIVGVGAVVNAVVGMALAVLVFVVVVRPASTAVVETVMLSPASDAVRTYVFDVAPEIEDPFRFHW